MNIEKTIEALRSNRMDVYYVHTAEEAKELALSLIPEGSSCASGGSVTLAETGIIEALKNGSFYSTMGPEFTRINWENGVLEAEFSPCAEVTVLSNSSYGWSIRRAEEQGEPATSLRLEIPGVLEKRESYKYLRIQLRDKDGKYAWSMPVFL